ncbi:MAG: hypothetical protein EXR70_09690 [Deltaproteobacteria bacterium]|nr:hypothetical protein [Deltaproteobacteria bacterium]
MIRQKIPPSPLFSKGGIRDAIASLAILLAAVLLGSHAYGAETAAAPDSEWERTIKAAEQEGQVNVY